jgi:hypothetical protein
MDPNHLLLGPAMLFTRPADVIDDASLDDGRKRLILRQWQHDAIKSFNPCRGVASSRVLAEIMDALVELKARQTGQKR